MHILLAAHDNCEEELNRAYEAGADGYVPGTITAAGLRIRLQAAQRLVRQQDDWEKDRAQLRQIAAELAVANRRLANVALTDLLTGLPNRRSAMDQLDQAWSAASRSGLPLSVMVVDIDHFKQINDTRGHLAGDHVLSELSRAVTPAIRTEDIFARYGGEEFVILSRTTPRAACRVVAERVRKTIEQHPFVFEGTRIPVTVSLGIGSLPDPGITTPEALLGMADKALYDAKRGGRNRVVVGG
jgi:two-component system, cell cycle response regulator